MCASIRGIHRNESGASAVEFALISPLLVILLFGIISMGWAMYSVSTVHLALEKSGRALQINPSLSQSQLQSMVVGSLSALGEDPDVTVSMATTTVSGATIAVLTGTYNFSVQIPLLPAYAIAYNTSVAVPLP